MGHDSSATCPTHATVADTVCSSFTRPSVAVILAGSARTFAQPLLYKTIRHNLLEAFGGEVTLLVYSIDSIDTTYVTEKHGGIAKKHGSRALAAGPSRDFAESGLK